MYLPKSFEETRVDVLHDLIRAHPLGTLVTLSKDGLDANHIPFEIDSSPAPFGILRGHVARANSIWNDQSRNSDALAIFQGPHTYVSPFGTRQRWKPEWSCRHGTMLLFTHMVNYEQ